MAAWQVWCCMLHAEMPHQRMLLSYQQVLLRLLVGVSFYVLS